MKGWGPLRTLVPKPTMPMWMTMAFKSIQTSRTNLSFRSSPSPASPARAPSHCRRTLWPHQPHRPHWLELPSQPTSCNPSSCRRLSTTCRPSTWRPSTWPTTCRPSTTSWPLTTTSPSSSSSSPSPRRRPYSSTRPSPSSSSSSSPSPRRRPYSCTRPSPSSSSSSPSPRRTRWSKQPPRIRPELPTQHRPELPPPPPPWTSANRLRLQNRFPLPSERVQVPSRERLLHSRLPVFWLPQHRDWSPEGASVGKTGAGTTTAGAAGVEGTVGGHATASIA
eukprot:jgi/Botrbrau1/1152/Bobra.0162s0041.2